MDNHPIPQDVTGFQFKLIGNMTVKQFAYLATGIILAGITYKLPINSLIRFPLCTIFALVGTGLAYLPISGRPMDVMIGNYIKALFSPTQFVYEKLGGQIYYPNKALIASMKKNMQRKVNFSMLPKDKLKIYLDSLNTKQKNVVDEKENNFLMSVSNLAAGNTSSQSNFQPNLAQQTYSPIPLTNQHPIEILTKPKNQQQQINPQSDLDEPTLLDNQDLLKPKILQSNSRPVITEQPIPSITLSTSPIPLTNQHPIEILTKPKNQQQQINPQSDLDEPTLLDNQDLLKPKILQSNSRPVITEQPIPSITLSTSPIPLTNQHPIEILTKPKNQQQQINPQSDLDEPTLLDNQDLLKPEALLPNLRHILIKHPSPPTTPPSSPAISQGAFFTKVTTKMRPNKEQKKNVESLPKGFNRTIGMPNIPDSPNLITGIAKDARGNDLSNILVEIKDKDGNPVRAFKTNEFGRFASATPLLNGTYTVEFEDPKGQNRFGKITINAIGQIISPVEAISIDMREELRRSLFPTSVPALRGAPMPEGAQIK